MEIDQAKEILSKIEKNTGEFNEAQNLVREDELRKLKEKEEAEKKRKKEEFESEKKRYPKSSSDLYTLCWNCKKSVNMSKGRVIPKATRIILINSCEKCAHYNICTISTNFTSSSDHDRFLPLIDLS
jgi:hypothetical protein